MKKNILMMVVLLVVAVEGVLAVYDLPDGACPDNCRKITWDAGLDPEGGIPDYPIGRNAVVDDGADNTGATDATTAISNCLSNTASQTACYLPAGTYRLNSGISIPSNKVLRGAGAGSTTLMLYGGGISFSGGTSWGNSIDVSIDPSKNDIELTLASITGLSVNDWVSIYQDDDASIPVTHTWTHICDQSFEGGSANGEHCMQQFAQITAINDNTITISRPLYYDYDDPINDMEVREVIWGGIKAGLEDLKIDGTNVDTKLISFRGDKHCWLKGIETYMAGSSNADAHVMARWTHGIEIRDSYFHHGHGYGSGANYGLMAFNWNSDMKIENNIYYSLRHGVAFEGGASGSVVLYNYFDAHQQSADLTFAGADLMMNHAAHPFMNLVEGNVATKIILDYVGGSSSHNVMFRNHARAYRSTPTYTWGDWAFDIQYYNRYESLVGNVVGMPDDTTGTVTEDDSNCPMPLPTEPIMFRFGCDGSPGSNWDSVVGTTVIRHGNYDFISNSVAHWDGGADHDLKDSMYYNSKPAFFGSEPWPCIGPDVNGYVEDIPAKIRFEAISEQTCTEAGGTCKTNSCNTYTDCTSLTGECTTGYCCSGTCTASTTCSAADANIDGVVDIAELMNYIGDWKLGSVTIEQLMTAIGEWKNGC